MAELALDHPFHRAGNFRDGEFVGICAGARVFEDVHGSPCVRSPPTLERGGHEAKRGGNEYPHPGRRRPRTCTGLGRQAEPQMRPSDRGARQCRDRDAGRMRRSRHHGRGGGGRFRRGECRRFRHRRARGAAGGRGGGRASGGGDPDLRPLGGGGAARGVEGVHQGDLRRLRRADRRLCPLHRCRLGHRPCPRARARRSW